MNSGKAAEGAEDSEAQSAEADRMHDVAIVGAGPSGAWTAYLLARRGARVVLVDPSHPR